MISQVLGPEIVPEIFRFWDATLGKTMVQE
jgi:hypothetical protein